MEKIAIPEKLLEKPPKKYRQQSNKLVKQAERMFQIDLKHAFPLIEAFAGQGDANYLTEEDHASYKYALLNMKLCSNCNSQTKYYEDSSFIYNGVNYGPVYHCNCTPGGIYVRCKKERPTVPLGYPANRQLRKLRKEAHDVFDPVWQQYRYTYGKHTTQDIFRTACYQALALELDIKDKRQCHIGWFNESQCRKVKQFCVSGKLHQVVHSFKRIAEAYKLKPLPNDMETPDFMQGLDGDLFAGYITHNAEEIQELLFERENMRKTPNRKNKSQRKARKVTRKKK